MSLLGISFFSRVVGVKQYTPLHLVHAIFWQKSCTKTMAISGSIVGSGDLMVDTSVSSCGNLFGFVKPHSVIFGDGSHKLCSGAKISIRSGENDSYHGGRGYSYEHRCNNFGLFHSSWLARGRAFSSSLYSDGIVPQASADGSLSSEQRPILAPSAQQSPIHSRLKLLSGACYLPHPAKEETGGEDAHFICADEQVIGVADGVGGWADVGVNAGEYARELMSNSAKAITEMVDGDIDPMQVLEKAHETTTAMGSSTACIVALKNQDLHAINLGDSGFIIVRDGSTIFESPVQQHGFNFTYQLERGNRADLPSSGQVFNIPVAPGDVVVVGSDGLFDNLFSKEIAAIVGNAVKEGLNPDATANKIAILARARALDREYQSPFSKAAREAGFSYCGGKLDDLTIVVSYVSAYADE